MLHERRASSPRGLRGRPSSGRCARAASPSPRPRADRSDTSAGRSRSGRTCRSVRAMADRAPQHGSRASSVTHPALGSGTGVTSDRSSSGVQDARRIERAFQRARHVGRPGRRAPDIDLLPSARGVARSTTTCPTGVARPQPLDGGSDARVASPSSRSSPAPDRDAACERRRPTPADCRRRARAPRPPASFAGSQLTSNHRAAVRPRRVEPARPTASLFRRQSPRSGAPSSSACAAPQPAPPSPRDSTRTAPAAIHRPAVEHAARRTRLARAGCR